MQGVRPVVLIHLNQIGIDRDRALCTLRISIGRSTTEEDVHGILAAFERVLSWQR